VKGLQFLSHKRKEPPCKSSEKFCRVKRRQNKSGVLRGGKNLHREQILATLYFSTRPRLRSNESPSGAFKRQSGLAQARWRGIAPTSSVGFAIEGIMECRARQDGFAKFIVVKQ